MAFYPKECVLQFMSGRSIKQIAEDTAEDERYIEAVVRSVMVGMDMAKPSCNCDE